MLCRLLLFSLLLLPCVHSLTVGGNSPQVVRRQAGAKRDASSFPNPLISARQVKADVVRRGTKTVQPAARAMKRQGGECPTPQVSGGCCPPGQQLCTQTNPAYCTTFTSSTDCGSCGNACTATEQCIDGACEPCHPGGIYCADVGTCVAAAAPNTCGSCDNACPYEQACLVTPGSGPWGYNYVCGCPTDYTLCGTECKILSQDVENCGTCGNTCDPGVYCNNGQCCPDSSPTTCNGLCVNTLTSTSYCGDCITQCSPSQTCTNGICEECADGDC